MCIRDREYAARPVQEMVDGQKHKEDAGKTIICALLKDDDLSNDTLQEIEKVLQDMRDQ